MTDEEKDVLTEETLINEILSELKIELEVESEQDILLLQSKIKGGCAGGKAETQLCRTLHGGICGQRSAELLFQYQKSCHVRLWHDWWRVPEVQFG